MAESSVAMAVVVDNKDDSGMGRVRVRYPWHSQPREVFWARVATPMTGKARGFYFIPEEGDEVLVAFERGDLRSPYVVGSLWNGSSPAPVTNTDGRNDVRVIRTRRGHTLTFDDGAEARMRLELNDGKHLAMDAHGITLRDEHGNGLTIHSDSGAVTIQSSGSITLQASQISIESSGGLVVQARGALTLRGSVVSIN